MIALELLVSLITALIWSVLFAVVIQKRPLRTGFFWFFLIVFLGTWVLGSWLRPFGPAIAGVHWVAFLAVGLIFALILAAAIPQRPPRGRRETLDMLDQMEKERELKEVTLITLSVFFWILLAVLIAALIIRYMT